MRMAQKHGVKNVALMIAFALLLFTGVATPARASDDATAFLTLLGGGLVAQLIEGMFVALIAVRRLGRDGILVILFFTLGMVVSWWFVLSVDGVIPLTEAVLGRLDASPMVMGGVLQALFWAMILIVGPVAAWLGKLLVRAIHRQRAA